jgi:acetoin utilization protein AcuA
MNSINDTNPDPPPFTPSPHQTSNPLKCFTINDTRFCIHTQCTPEEIKSYSFDPQFGMHAQYKSLYTKRETLEANAAEQNANVTLAMIENNIIGFGVLNYPEAGERWLDLGQGLMMEVKAIEVCRRYRSLGVASQILEMLVMPKQVRDLIIYMVGYSWTWDLDGTGHSALDYRNMLIRLFEPFGFHEMQTNEPNICLKPENLFMARIGAEVSTDIQQQFKWLRFGVAP